MNTESTSTLSIAEDLVFERREWFIQRVGWGAIALLILMALAGFFGDGPVSSAKAGNPNLLEVQYPRFVRHSHSMDVQVSVSPLAVTGTEVRLSVSRDYLAAFDLERITPEPERTESTTDALVYVFPIQAPQAPLKVTFTLQPEQLGQHSASIALQTGEPVKFDQFTYP